MGRQRKTGKRTRSSLGDHSERGSGPATGGEGNEPAKTSKPPQPRSTTRDLDPGLYVVATPIGHSRDITLRALETLASVDVIACEDTRVSGKLLAIHGISTPMTPYHEHNAQRAGPALIKRLDRGDRVALVSDAGTPLVSDPGYRLVRDCIESGIPVVPLPGPSAPVAALSVSGLPTDRFFFAGFPPPRTAARRRFLAEISEIPATLVMMESPRRLAASLTDMADVLGAREAVVAREITKMFEEIKRGTLDALAEALQRAESVKGEITIVVAPPEGSESVDAALLIAAIKTMSVRDAVDAVAAETHSARSQVYSRALALHRERT